MTALLSRHLPTRALLLTTAILAFPPVLEAQSAQPAEPPFLADRGTGVATSMFGTFIRKGELIVYPFFEYYRDDDYEYKAEELGAVGDVDYRGRYRAREGLVMFGYGVTEDLAIEFEMAGISASLEKAAADPSSLPPQIEESGLGDVEAQVRWRWKRETERRPEWFSYGEVVFPHHGDKVLIGSPGWEFKAGTGVTRGFSWGTLTARAAVEFATESTSQFDMGEYAVEYLKRLSPHWRLYAGIEGQSDEVSAIGELQWHITPRVMVKMNSGVGLTSKATDWAPEIGILFSIPVR